MAKTLIQKSIKRIGDNASGVVSFEVTGGDTLAGADFQFPAENGDTLTFIPRRIDLITNSESSVVAVDGKNYASGSWNYHHFGGIPCGASVVVGSGHIVLQLRS